MATAAKKKVTRVTRTVEKKPARVQRVVRKSDGGGNYFASPNEHLRFIHTGSTMLDLALGGGWVEGRVSNIIGDKSTGKTLQCIEACANFARKYPKGKLRYREVESAFDNQYAAALGFPVDRIDFGGHIRTVEDFFKDMQKIVVGSKTDELVILDSLDALSDDAELAREVGEGSFGTGKAKLLSEMFRRLIAEMEFKRVTLIIISQVRDNIGAFGAQRSWKRSGGRALDFYASQVVVLANTGRLTQTVLGQKRATGVKVKATVDKNKVGLPFREALYQIRFGYGLDDAQSMVDFLAETKRLKLADIRPDEVKGFLNYLLEQPRDVMDREMENLRRICKETWYEIETKSVPSRAKYA